MHTNTPKSEVYNMDCLDAMREMPDNAFDLAIVDPPYGIGEADGKNHSRGKITKPKLYTKKQWDNTIPSNEYFVQLKRVSKNQIIWGANHFGGMNPSPCWIVWDKNNGDTDFADCELAYTSFKTSVRRFLFTWSGMRQGNMKQKEERLHPTQKPIALYKWLLSNYAKQGDRILDTHLGSGSSRIAAYDMGFDFVGYELDAEYFDAMNKRFAAHISRPAMFAPDEMYQIEQKKLFEQ